MDTMLSHDPPPELMERQGDKWMARETLRCRLLVFTVAHRGRGETPSLAGEGYEVLHFPVTAVLSGDIHSSLGWRERRWMTSEGS